MKLNELTATQLKLLVAHHEVRATEVVKAVLDAIEDKDKGINAFITVLRDQSLEKAATLDKKIENGGPLGALAGIPVAIKDNICVKGVPTTCASRMLAQYLPPYNATIIERLEAADAIIIGKTNMDEFAMGSSNENSAWGPVKNPHDGLKVPGGSSGGSAAATAAHETILAVGSDTGGSIRQPASFCGVTGLKPTYGRVSRYGLVAYASSLDQIGPLGKNVEDTALLLSVLAGYDPRDSTSALVPVPDYTDLVLPADGVAGYTFGVPKEYLTGDLDKQVQEAFGTALKSLQQAGAHCQELSLEHTPYAIPAYYLIASAEASSNLARYDGVKYGFRATPYIDLEDMYIQTRTQGFGDEVKRRIMLGTYALSSGYYDAYYLKALKARTMIKDDFDTAFKQCDFIITPTAPTAAFSLGEKTADPIQMYLSDIYTIAGNLAGIPGLSVPGGRNAAGLPLGLQLYGRPFAEHELFKCAGWLEGRLSGNQYGSAH